MLARRPTGSPQQGEVTRQQAKFRPESQVILFSECSDQRMSNLTYNYFIHEMKYLESILTTNSMLYAKRYPLYAVIPSTTVENSLQIKPFYAKQSQYCVFFARKHRFYEKTNPIQTQFKANLSQFQRLKLPAIYIEIGFNTVYYITLKLRNTIYEIKWKILSIPKPIQEVSND